MIVGLLIGAIAVCALVILVQAASFSRALQEERAATERFAAALLAQQGHHTAARALVVPEKADPAADADPDQRRRPSRVGLSGGPGL